MEGLRDMVLVHACLAGDRGALRIFEHEVMHGVGAAVSRIETSADAVDELKQRIVATARRRRERRAQLQVAEAYVY